MKLFLKGPRCDTPKCSLMRRERPPGEHPFGRGKPSAYAAQLREKQRAKRFYGVKERQFRRYFGLATRAAGNTGENLLVLLERRLDNVLYRSGIAVSRAQGRQWINHGNVRIDDRRADVPSYLVHPNQVIALAPDEAIQKIGKESLELSKNRPSPAWLEVSEDTMQARVVSLPSREDVSVPIQEQMIVELLSK